ncbi:MAG: hypothetical protein R3E39_12680 [Anaerolineae bacterium]
MPVLVSRIAVLLLALTLLFAGGAFALGRSLPEPQQLTYTAFFSRPGHNAMDIYSLDVSHWLVARLTAANGIYEDSMWSPDGQRMAYIQENSSEQRLYVLNANTHTIRGFGGHVYTSLIGWSPDSRYISFQTVDYSGANLNLADVVEPDVFAVNVPNNTNARIFWTPDSTHLFYLVKNGNQAETLYGLEPTCLPAGTECGGYDIATLPFSYLGPARALYEWSPDGNTLILSGAAEYQLDLYSLQLNCPAQSRCTAGVERLTDTVDDETAPTWSPHGDEIAYVADHSNVGIFDAATGAHRRIYEGDRAIRWLEYSPDGHWISVWSTDKRTEYITYIDLVDVQTGAIYPLSDGGLSHWFPAWKPLASEQ